MKTITIKMGWREALQICLASYENGTAEGRKIALEELNRMADVADKAIELQNELREYKESKL